MALRWYTVVVDCLDVRAQAAWWEEALDWHKVYEAEDEVVLVPRDVTAETAGTTPWEQQKPGMVFVKVTEHKSIKNRLHIDLAPHTSQDRDAEIERLLGLGARRIDVGQAPDVGWDVFADPEGNEFCVLSSREF
jgi:Glyoxalase-like domain